jgi:hypothetical protein
MLSPFRVDHKPTRRDLKRLPKKWTALSFQYRTAPERSTNVMLQANQWLHTPQTWRVKNAGGTELTVIEMLWYRALECG